MGRWTAGAVTIPGACFAKSPPRCARSHASCRQSGPGLPTRSGTDDGGPAAGVGRGRADIAALLHAVWLSAQSSQGSAHRRPASGRGTSTQATIAKDLGQWERMEQARGTGRSGLPGPAEAHPSLSPRAAAPHALFHQAGTPLPVCFPSSPPQGSVWGGHPTTRHGDQHLRARQMIERSRFPLSSPGLHLLFSATPPYFTSCLWVGKCPNPAYPEHERLRSRVEASFASELFSALRVYSALLA